MEILKKIFNKNIIPNNEQINIGSSNLKFNEFYGNNIRAHTSLYSSNIRPYSGSTIHFYNANITTDHGYSLSVDSLYSSATNRDLYLGNGPSDIKMRFINGVGGETQTYSSIVPSNNDGLIDVEERQAIKATLKIMRSTRRVEIEKDKELGISADERRIIQKDIRDRIAHRRADEFAKLW